MRGMIKQVVGDLAERVYECEDGDDALAAYSANQPDWVLMDIQMKNTNGLTATRQIVSEFADAQIVIVTNYDDDDLRRAATTAGAHSYILKDNLLALRPLLKEAQTH